MTALACLQARRGSPQPEENWPCAFKQLWFHDMPFLMIPDLESSGLATTKASGRTVLKIIRRGLLNVYLSKMYVNLRLRMREMEKNLIKPIIFSKHIISTRTKAIAAILPQRHKKAPPPTLSSIPVELRLKIFDYVTHGTCVNVVGYRQGRRDSFYFKKRGHCPIAMTCKRFYVEALEMYFRNLSVNIKAACPSEFSGDMSTFGAATFRDRLRKIKIADVDTARRLRICAAFKNADIECSDKCSPGARKGAYYFG